MFAVAVAVVALLLSPVSLSAQSLPQTTFTRDVLPILQQNCQTCHRPGQMGPMPLMTFQQVRPWARAIKAKVLERAMPPWFADPAHGTFTNDRSLKDAEIETIRRWVDGGSVEGSASEAPQPVSWPEHGWQITPDLVVSLPEFSVPAKGVLDWQSFAVPFPATRDTWVTSVEVLPSNPSVVHHICFNLTKHRPDIVYGRYEWEDVPRDASGVQSRGLLTRLSSRLTSATFKTRMAGSAEILTMPGRSSLKASGSMCYVPGLSTHDYRVHNAAKLVPAGFDIVVTFHYVTTGKPAVDRPRIGFTVAKQPPAMRFVEISPSGATRDFAIPPYEGNYAVKPFEIQIRQDARLVWMWPHMHVRGKDATYTLIRPDGSKQIVLRVPRYDFNWQLGYLTSVAVPKGSRLRIDAHWDNSSRNRANPDPSAWVYRGQQSWEEMFTPSFGLIVGRNVDIRSLTSPFEAEEGG